MLVIQLNKKLLPDTKIVRAEEYAALTNAEAILEEAKSKAKKIVAQANTQADLILQEAKRCYEEEKKRGFSEGEEEGQQKVLETLFKMVERGVDYLESIEKTLVHVVKNSIERILGEIEDEKRIVLLVNRALKEIKNAKTVKIKVSPEQLSYVRENLDQFSNNHKNFEFLDAQSDNNLEPDQCILETETGILDASLNVQVNALLKAIETVVR